MSVIEPGLLDAPPLGSAAPGGQPGNDPAEASPQFFDLLASMGRDPANAYDDGQGWGGTQDLQASAGRLDPGPLPSTPGPAPGDGPAEASGRPAHRDDDAGPSLPDLPDPPGPPTPGQSAAAAAPGCHGFERAGRIGGAVAGGTLEGLRQAAPGALLGGATGALAGAGQGLVAGAGRGFVVGAGTGALAGGGGAVPGAVVGTAGGATLGTAAGAVRGGAMGAVVGGAPGFAKGFGDGMAPGAKAGAGVGRWLDGTHLGLWVQGCPAPDSPKPADKAQVLYNQSIPSIDEDKQGKHIAGHKNYDPDRSMLTDKPQDLAAKYAGRGQPVNNTPKGDPGFKERFNAGHIIGIYKDASGNSTPTTNGMIVYSKTGIHIYPIRP